jgi:hypothetical protein
LLYSGQWDSCYSVSNPGVRVSPDEKQSYKLPFATVVAGGLQAVPRGIQAVAVVLEGGRGGVELPDAVISDVRSKVESYYEKMGDEVPW